MFKGAIVPAGVALLLWAGCKSKNAKPELLMRSLEVTATAYNSTAAQTDTYPLLGAWEDTLHPGLKAIAVSRDLLSMGLGPGDTVTLDGMPGHYIVLDKMHSRWKKRLDIYFGKDVQAARSWGEKRVVLRWAEPEGQVDSTTAVSGETEAFHPASVGGTQAKEKK